MRVSLIRSAWCEVLIVEFLHPSQPLEARFPPMSQPQREQLKVARERAILVAVQLPRDGVDLENRLKELQSLADTAGAEIIGINHRDLKTFNVDTSLSLRLRPLIPEDRLIVAESGISSAADVVPLKQAGINAVLVGEAIVTADDPEAKVRELAGV